MIAFFDLPWVPLFVAAAFLLHPVFGFLAIGTGILTLIITLINEYSTKKSLIRATQASISAHADVSATLRNAEVMRAMGMAPGLKDRWATATRRANLVAGHGERSWQRADGRDEIVSADRAGLHFRRWEAICVWRENCLPAASLPHQSSLAAHSPRSSWRLINGRFFRMRVALGVACRSFSGPFRKT